MDVQKSTSRALQAIRPADLPAPPQAAMQVLRACAADDVDNRRLAGLVSSDPVLTAELLRIANSPFYGLGHEVRSAAQAITVLGHKALRNLVLSIAVRDALRHSDIPEFEIVTFWEHALRGAAAAKLLALTIGADAEECFTAGLLSDFSLLGLFHLQPQQARVWRELRALDPETRRVRERQCFGFGHDELASVLARTWVLPAELRAALEGHHGSDAAAPLPGLAGVLHCADWMAAVYEASDPAAVLEQCRARLGRHLDLSAEQADAALAELPAQVTQAAQALGLHLDAQPEFDTVLRHANLRLAEANLSYQELAWELQQALRERDVLAAQLKHELALAGEIQQSLLPGSAAAALPVYAINVPAGELSGDFYDYFALADGRVYFNLADVSGKGVTAALLMAKASSLFHCLGKQVHDPAQLLQVLNRELCETSTHGMFVTMVAGIFDPVSDEVELVNAGNPPALLLGADGGVEQVAAHGPPLGVVTEAEFSQTRLRLAERSLYLFSDGVSEACMGGGAVLGIEGLMALLLTLSARPPGERLGEVVRKLAVGEKRRDDITLLLVERPR